MHLYTQEDKRKKYSKCVYVQTYRAFLPPIFYIHNFFFFPFERRNAEETRGNACQQQQQHSEYIFMGKELLLRKVAKVM